MDRHPSPELNAVYAEKLFRLIVEMKPEGLRDSTAQADSNIEQAPGVLPGVSLPLGEIQSPTMAGR
jgi:hypothetical protein